MGKMAYFSYLYTHVDILLELLPRKQDLGIRTGKFELCSRLIASDNSNSILENKLMCVNGLSD